MELYHFFRTWMKLQYQDALLIIQDSEITVTFQGYFVVFSGGTTEYDAQKNTRNLRKQTKSHGPVMERWNLRRPQLVGTKLHPIDDGFAQ